jgi:coatomer protein complex subunit gamma
MAQDVIMVTSSVTRDMNSKSDVIYRANAIRALCKITDVTRIGYKQRHFRLKLFF